MQQDKFDNIKIEIRLIRNRYVSHVYDLLYRHNNVCPFLDSKIRGVFYTNFKGMLEKLLENVVDTTK